MLTQPAKGETDHGRVPWAIFSGITHEPGLATNYEGLKAYLAARPDAPDAPRLKQREAERRALAKNQ